jgi:hypothetical protein
VLHLACGRVDVVERRAAAMAQALAADEQGFTRKLTRRFGMALGVDDVHGLVSVSK